MSSFTTPAARTAGSRRLVRGGQAFIVATVALGILWTADLASQALEGGATRLLAAAALAMTLVVVPSAALWLRGSGLVGALLGEMFGMGLATESYLPIARVIDPATQPLDPGTIEGLGTGFGILLGGVVLPAGLVAWAVGAIGRMVMRERARRHRAA